MSKKPKPHQDVEGFLVHSAYFRKYILPDWLDRNPEAARALVLQVRGDPKAEEDVQYHLERVRKG